VKKAQAEILCKMPVRGTHYAGRASEEQKAEAYRLVEQIRKHNARGVLHSD
jgi:hypothetical protein